MSDKDKGHGKPIRGEEAPFANLDLRGATNPEGFFEFREDLKAVLAARMLCVVKTKPIRITKDVLNIIEQMIDDRSVNSFIWCTSQYYIGENHRHIRLVKKCPSCTSSDRYKSMKHAQQDSLLLNGKKYLLYVQQNLPRNIDEDIKDDLRAAKLGVAFFANYILYISVGCIPRTLSKTQYKLIKDSSEKDHWNNQTDLFYRLDEEKNIYTKINGKIFYSALNLETATAIFCCHYLKK